MFVADYREFLFWNVNATLITVMTAMGQYKANTTWWSFVKKYTHLLYMKQMYGYIQKQISGSV